MSDSMHAMSRLKSILTLSAVLVVTAAAVAIAGAPIICTGGPCTGTPGNDDIAGSANDDQIRALAGSDSTQGGGGDDTHVGGLGNDDLSEFGGDGNGGRDILRGGAGSDYAEGNTQADRIIGGAGNDREVDAPFRATRRGGPVGCFQGFCSSLFGDAGNDFVSGGKGSDYLEGEEGADTMVGGKGRDVIDAANDDAPGANDRVRCGAGRDTVFADPGDEVDEDCERVRPPRPDEL
jgi:Ca2+-binding RTX toxin-like protein